MTRPVAAIIGLGLIGGSLLRALRQAGGWRLLGTDADEQTIAEAWRAGYLPEAALSPEKAVREADLVVLCVPMGAIGPLVRRLKPCLKPGAVVTDVSSVKGGLAQAVQQELGAGSVFIGGHPMAGSELHGWHAARADLFAGKAYMLERTPGAPEQAVALVERMVLAVGARPVWMTPAVHDRATALISHAPHVVASAMVLAAAEDEQAPEAMALAASCFRDMTRVTASNPEMWVEITSENRQEVARALHAVSRRMLDVAAALTAGDEAAVRAFFTAAFQAKKDFLLKDGGPNVG